MERTMKLIITGGSGFIGTNAVEHFSKHFEVINIDHQKPQIEEHMKYWRNVDLLDYDSLSKTIQDFNPDYILHLAARTDLMGETLDDYSANTIGVDNLLKAVKKLKNLKKILVTSSMLVCHVGYIPKDQFDYSATTLYGKSKVETEKLTWNADLQCDWALLRPTSIWGPWFHEPYRNFFNMVKKRAYFHIGHKGCTKTYGYIGNSIYQIEHILMADTNDRNNKVFFIGDRPAINITEWANQIGNELGFRIPVMPWVLIKVAAYFGDALKAVGIKFPMTSFRLKNMTTDNVIPLDNTYEVAPNPPFDRLAGIRNTLKWMENH